MKQPVITLERVEELLARPKPGWELYPKLGIWLTANQARVYKEAGYNIGEPKEWE